MRCLTVFMSVLIAACILTPATSQSSTLDIQYVGSVPGPYFVKTDAPCFVSRLVCSCGDGRHFHEEENLPSRSGVAETLPFDRVTSWRLDYGDLAAFNWDVIREALRLFHGVDVGAAATCHVATSQKPVEGYDVRVAVYTAYERRVYRLQKGDDVAALSVLVPVHGVARVYSNVVRLTTGSCGCMNPPAPASDPGLCAGLGRIPYAGECGNGNDKRDFRDEPVLPSPGNELNATWGGIKALYE